MRRYLPVAAVLLAWAGTAHAHGLLIPEDKTLPPLAMLNHKVTIAIEDQVAVTRVEQTFRNHTDRAARSHLRLPACPRAPASTSSPCGSTARKSSGETASRPPRPARSTPTSSAAPRTPACWSTSATTCCSCKVFPDPGPRRPEGGPELHQRRRQRERRPGRVRLSAQDRRQGHRHAGGVLHHGDDQDRSTASATSTARRTPSPSSAPTTTK